MVRIYHDPSTRDCTGCQVRHHYRVAYTQRSTLQTTTFLTAACESKAALLGPRTCRDFHTFPACLLPATVFNTRMAGRARSVSARSDTDAEGGELLGYGPWLTRV